MSTRRGLLLVDKPAGMTSHDVVAVVRRAARSKRVGHAGTLDPFATGLLVLAVGAYTRLLPYVHGEPKVYDAEIRFGAETDTDDGTGRVTVERAPPTDAAVDIGMAALTGALLQVPPAYSAKHVDGERAHALARRGADLVLPPVPVTVHRWEAARRDGSMLQVRIVCAGGTYVRALARDLGRLAGSAAHCSALRRVASGAATIDDAVALAALAPGAIADGAVELRDPVPYLGDVARVTLDDAGVADVLHGRSVGIDGSPSAGARAVLLRDGGVLAMAAATATADGRARWHPRVVFPDDGSEA